MKEQNYTEQLDKIKKEIQKKYEYEIKTVASVTESPKQVIPISPLFNLQLSGGIPEGSVVLISGPAKCGKEQPLDSLVYTPSGPKRMGDMQVGDVVCTPDGGIANVVGVFPQGMKDVYEVEFCDGQKVECGLEHLWKAATNNSSSNSRPYAIVSLNDILNRGIHYSNRLKWKIPITEPIYYEEREVDIDPYILGCLLGDGNFTQSTPRITSSNSQLIDTFRQFAKDNNMKITDAGGISYRIVTDRGKPNHLTDSLRKYGLMGTNSKTKFIPYNYKYNSLQKRIAIIRGLLDTDGNNSGRNFATFTSISKQMVIDLVEIVRSIGYKCRITSNKTSVGNTHYRVHISGENVNDLFTLYNKKYDGKRSKPPIYKKIKNVRKLDEQKECQCISIDSEDGLYLTDGLTVTHNTTVCLHLAQGAKELDGRPIFYFDIEGRYKEMNLHTVKGFDPECMQWIHSTPDRILTGEDHLNIAWDVIQNVPRAVIIIDSTSQLCSSDELYGEIKQGIRPSGPMLLSAFTRKLSAVCSVRNATVIMIQHVIADTGMSRKTKSVSGGNKIQYQADVNLECSHFQDWMDGETLIGKVSHWKVVTSAIGGPTNSFPAYIRYGVGLDKIKEVVEISSDMGLISKSGAWFKLDCLANLIGEDEVITQYVIDQGLDPESDKKVEMEKVSKVFNFQGIAKTREFLDNNPYMLKLMESQMTEFMA